MKTHLIDTLQTPLFSFFTSPIMNIKPSGVTDLQRVYNLVISDEYRERTEHLRSITDPKEAGRYKIQNFDYITPAGIFTKRSDQALIAFSGLTCIGFDQVANVGELRARLLMDKYFETQILFVSPSGNGLKWFIRIDPKVSYTDFFRAIQNYIRQAYGLHIDRRALSVSRACFLCYDPKAHLNQRYHGRE